MANGDRLRAINDAIRRDLERQTPRRSEPLLPLESNPQLFTEFARRAGLRAPWRFADVWSLPGDDDDEVDVALSGSPAVLLLFPCTAGVMRARGLQDRTQRSSFSIENCFFMAQMEEHGNACGTFAATHAMANADLRDPHTVFGDERAKLGGEKLSTGEDGDGLAKDGALARFVRSSSALSPEERGLELLQSAELMESSDAAASHHSAQTALPDRYGPALDHHFVAFVRTRDNRLLELDGTKRGAFNCGTTTPERFVRDAAAVIRREFMNVDPDNVEFSLLALIYDRDIDNDEE